MQFPSTNRFADMVLSDPEENIVTKVIFPGVPYLFRHEHGVYGSLRSHLAGALNVPEDDITVVGSARLGFSPSPDSDGFPKRFTEGSDVDVVVVSSVLFDAAWQDLLAWHRGRRWVMAQSRSVRIVRQNRSAIYWGGIWPHLMVRFSAVSRTWADAFGTLGRIPALAPWKVNGKLYRTWPHALQYHANSLRELAARLRREARPL